MRLAQDILRDWQEMKKPQVPCKSCYNCKMMRPLTDYLDEGLRTRICNGCLDIRRQKAEGAAHVAVSN